VKTCPFSKGLLILLLLASLLASPAGCAQPDADMDRAMSTSTKAAPSSPTPSPRPCHTPTRTLIPTPVHTPTPSPTPTLPPPTPLPLRPARLGGVTPQSVCLEIVQSYTGLDEIHDEPIGVAASRLLEALGLQVM
jgi:hypothetical protein